MCLISITWPLWYSSQVSQHRTPAQNKSNFSSKYLIYYWKFHMSTVVIPLLPSLSIHLHCHPPHCLILLKFTASSSLLTIIYTYKFINTTCWVHLVLSNIHMCLGLTISKPTDSPLIAIVYSSSSGGGSLWEPPSIWACQLIMYCTKYHQFNKIILKTDVILVRNSTATKKDHDSRNKLGRKGFILL